jgi:hypothetical protein
MYILEITLEQPQLTLPRNLSMFEQDPFLVVARGQPFWVCCLASTPVWGLISTRLRRIKEPLAVGFLVCTGGIIGLATIEPDGNTKSLVFAGLAGIGFGALIVLIVAAVQLSAPHHLIATATAVTVSSRAVSASVFTAICVAAFSDRLKVKLPSYIAAAALKSGLPKASLKDFAAALVGDNQTALIHIEGATPGIISAGVVALKQAYADSVRVVYILAAPFGVAAAISCWFLADMRKTMNYKVDAPIENLTIKVPHKQMGNDVSV